MQSVSGCPQIYYVSELGGVKKHVIFLCIFDVFFAEGGRASSEGATIYFYSFHQKYKQLSTSKVWGKYKGTLFLLKKHKMKRVSKNG